MAVSKLIPNSPDPFVCNINGVIYSYKAGTTQSVPDEVAALIDNINANAPTEDDPTVTIVTAIDDNATDKQIPTAKAVKNYSGNGPLVVTVTYDSETYEATTSASSSEIFDAMLTRGCTMLLDLGDGTPTLCNIKGGYESSISAVDNHPASIVYAINIDGEYANVTPR